MRKMYEYVKLGCAQVNGGGAAFVDLWISTNSCPCSACVTAMECKIFDIKIPGEEETYEESFTHDSGDGMHGYGVQEEGRRPAE